MRIYNRKGLIWGIIWTAAGGFCLYRDLADAHEFLPQQIKSVALSLLMLAIGLTGFFRAFSAKATQEDRIEEMDERNRMIRLKTESRVGSILIWTQLVIMVLGVLGYAVTRELIFGFVFLIPGLNISLCFVLGILFTIYYEKRL